MTVATQVSVIGVKQALAELNSVNKRYRRGVTIRYKHILQPMVDAATHMIPVRPPLSGWDRAWDPRPGVQNNTDDDYDPDKQILPWPSREFFKQFKIKPRPFISGKRPKRYGGFVQNLTTMGMRWDGRYASLFDQANEGHTPQGRRMVSVLSSRYGAPSRAMWRAYEQAWPEVQQELLDLIEDIMAAVGRNIKIKR